MQAEADLLTADSVSANPQARRTTTADSVLGVLSICPMSGYDIRRLIESSIGNFWNESFGQIYPALRRLEAEGCVAGEQHITDGRPPRTVYSLTDRGRDRLIAWLGSAVHGQVPRNELLLKLFFGQQLGPERSIRHLRSFLAEQKKLHGRYQAIVAMLETEQREAPAMPYWRLTARYGLRQTEALMQWAQDAIDELQHLPTGTTAG
jgi:PadR family transcriptional regulator, regulatory protein AphA